MIVISIHNPPSSFTITFTHIHPLNLIHTDIRHHKSHPVSTTYHTLISIRFDWFPFIPLALGQTTHIGLKFHLYKDEGSPSGLSFQSVRLSIQPLSCCADFFFEHLGIVTTSNVNPANQVFSFSRVRSVHSIHSDSHAPKKPCRAQVKELKAICKVVKMCALPLVTRGNNFIQTWV